MGQNGSPDQPLEMLPTAITYDGLPLGSGGAHSVRMRSAVKLASELRAFARTCGGTTAPAWLRADVDGHGSHAALIDEFTGRFGHPTVGRGAGDVQRTWLLDDVAWDSALEILDRHRLVPESDFQPLARVMFRFELRFLDPSTSNVLAGQSSTEYGGFEVDPSRLLGASWIDARLGNSGTVNAWFSLPFEGPSIQLNDYASWLQSKLPFRLSRSAWRVWRLNRQRTRYYSRKVQAMDGRKHTP